MSTMLSDRTPGGTLHNSYAGGHRLGVSSFVMEIFITNVGIQWWPVYYRG